MEDLYKLSEEEIIDRIENLQNFDGGNENVLFWSSINGYNEIIKKLIDAYTKNPLLFPLKINKFWNLALRYAGEHGHKETVELLLKHGADEPSDDKVTVTRTNSKTGMLEKKIVEYNTEITPECAKNFPDRYYFLLLDWIMDSCSPSIFNMIKTHIESKNPSFTYTERLKDPKTFKYKPRYFVIGSKKKKADKEKNEDN